VYYGFTAVHVEEDSDVTRLRIREISARLNERSLWTELEALRKREDRGGVVASKLTAIIRRRG